MSSIGSIAINFHEGSRSEYLATYIFSAFGSAVQVPHQEDYGIDLFCNLGTRIGKRAYMQDGYYVQIKSNKSEIEIQDVDSISWIYSLRHPLFFCFVNKKLHKIEIYQTYRLHHYHSKPKITSVKFIPDIVPDYKMVAGIPETDLKIEMDKPILAFTLDQMLDDNWFEKTLQVLQTWIRFMQQAIDNRAIGFPLIQIPPEYQTNTPLHVGEKMQYAGNFLDVSDEMKFKLRDNIYKLYSTIIVEAIAAKDQKKFVSLADSIGYVIGDIQPRYAVGLATLQHAINDGARQFKMKPPLDIKFPT